MIEDAPTLLAVDLGLRTGLALYRPDGRLQRYCSHHYGTPAQLRRATYHLLAEPANLAWLVLEGGGPLAHIWQRQARRAGISVMIASAEDWRAALLYPRSQRSGRRAKHSAAQLARRVIAWSGAAAPTALRHDAAEAILVGLWAVVQVGWLEELPAELRRI